MQFQTVHEQIRAFAMQTPQKTAIEWGNQRVSYKELEERANQIANFLYNKLGESKNIAVMFENSVELIEAIIGVLKCGGVFAPIDPGFPENRIQLMMERIDADWIVTRSEWLEKLDQMVAGKNRRINALVLDAKVDASQFKNINVYDFDQTLEKECLVLQEISNKHCYIYFTSGSTGKPKAILGRHKSLKHFIDWEIKEFGLDENFRVSQIISPSFDPFLRDVFVPLCAGATLCIPKERDIILYPHQLKGWIDENQITLMHIVPTLFKALTAEIEDGDCFESLQYILLAGELLRGVDVKRFFQVFGEKIQLVNLYGPTETTLAKLFYRVQVSDVDRVSIPVGKPITKAQVMILDEDMQSCVSGTVGEIYIRTPFISSGYYKDRDLTRKVFLKNPFTDNRQDIIYKTGDLGRILQSGDLEILGRIDHQVKIRGMRIELGEIENQILQLESVKEAVVVAKEDTTGSKYLCGYLVLENQKMEVEQLKEVLQKNLPDYMVPGYFVQLDEMPLTPNGKIDRKALPDPDVLAQSVEYVAPETAIEESLVRLWSEVLGKDEIGVNHNFFELGGHSLKAASIVTKIHKELNVEVPLKEIFSNPTIKELAACIEEAEENHYSLIKPVEEQEYYPVSSAQRRIYVLNQLEQSNVSYNLPRIMKVKGNLDRLKMEESIQALIRRHETLRTSFATIEGEVIQKIHPEIEFQLAVQEVEQSELKVAVREFIQPFNLEKAPLLRVGLIKFADDEHILLFDTHHIISDGSSMDILVRDFVSLYRDGDLPELAIQYKDFSAWQNELFINGAIEKQEKYWLDTFAGAIPVLNMPTDYPRPAMQSFDGDIFHFEADQLLTRRLNELAKENGTTLYMVLLASYNLLLSKYSGQEDIVVGSPIAGRSHMDLQDLIGVFINTLAMRNYPERDLTFKGFLQEVKNNALKAYENQDYQFEQLVNQLNIPRDLSRNPLFDTLFVLHNNDHSELAIDGLQFDHYPLEDTMSKFDLTLSGEEWDGKIGFNIEYCTKLFKQETMERLADHYLSVLKQVVEDAEVKLADIDILQAKEKEKILKGFNNTKVEYSIEKTVHEMFEEQVAKTPDHIALVFEGNELTYQELNMKANQLARLLREKGVNSETMVGIMVERSLEMMIGIFAVLKSGGTYLPIDPEYPAERIKYVLENSGAEILLTQEFLSQAASALPVESIYIDEEKTYQGDTSNLELVGGANSMAYMIYTSGSTGKPKGVMIEHRAVNNFIKGVTDKINFTSYQSILALTTISFDIFGLETLLPLTLGLKVVIGNDEHQKDTKALNIIITKYKVEMLQMTPSRMRMLLNDEQSVSCLKDVKVIMIGGEAFPAEMLEEVKNVTDAEIYNMYGPTESTIWSTIKNLTDTKEITIGQPIANTGILILDSYNRLQPIGVPGELCITGDGLARGYWKRSDLTTEKFVSNPFNGISDYPIGGERMYRTGDLARWMPNGELEFMGRIDHQVKIRGYRIELGEIESQLIKHESVKETVVVARADTSGGKYLCAYIVGETELNLPELKAHLGKELPDYMIPTFFIPIDQIPFTPNGKIDRKALPEPDAGLVSGVEYVAPSTEIEEKLIKIWEEVLGIEGIGINHNFFDVGGNSINIIKVISLISKRMGIHVPMGELFLRPTVAEIAHNMFIESPMNGLECVVSLNKPTEGKKNVFILHTWEGIIYQYKEIAKALEGEYNFYGIQAKGVLKPAKLPETLEEMVTDYICEMKVIQPEGPYIIAGYCYGNWIAYKMIDMLEDQDVPIERVIQIDENAFLPDKFRMKLRVRTELLRPYRFFRKWARKLITRRNINPMDMWPDLEEWNASKPPVEGEIKNEMTVRENVNHLCTVGLMLDYIIKTDVYVIKAEENNLVRYTAEAWKKQADGKVWFLEIPGGHESIFAYPYVDGLIEAVRRALEE